MKGFSAAMLKVKTPAGVENAINMIHQTDAPYRIAKVTGNWIQNG